jgi:DNA-binding NarL/FixJ family response regulator
MTNGPINPDEIEAMLCLMHTHPDLTTAQLRILALAERGLKNSEIANLLGCSLRNIENHRYRIGKKIRMG